MHVTATTPRLTLDDLVPYGPGLGRASLIMRALFNEASKTGSKTITPTHIFTYLLDGQNEGEIFKNLFNIKDITAFRNSIGRAFIADNKRTNTASITINPGVQFVFRRAKQVSNELGDRYVASCHVAIALFEEIEQHPENSTVIKDLMSKNGVTASDVRNAILSS